ncbi:MAG: DUF4838 domain-containing protein [Sediminibacterium sp.]
MKPAAVLFIMICTFTCSAQPLQLAKDGSSDYSICTGSSPSGIAIKAANVLQDYFYRVTGVRLTITKAKVSNFPVFYIGYDPSNSMTKDPTVLREDGFIIRTDKKNIIIAGKNKGTLYGVYTFIEKYMNCRKWDGQRAVSPINTSLTILATTTEKQEPAMAYREVYFPAAFDDEYLDWHKLNRFENIWGLWGHSFFKLVPPKIYFASHPEYFSLVNGKREPLQLCLSNSAVLKITIDQLQKRIAENPQAKYWSVSANDDIGNCECVNCSKLDAADGGPQGSLIHFVNAVAAHFPDKKITTLAYGYSAHATVNTRPANNVVIMLSSIDAYRSKSLEKEETATSFRNNLLQWKEKTSQLYIWDYCTQFTNYLTPFPTVNTFSQNINYLLQQGVSGIFEQGSADTYSDMAALKSYLLAKLLWNPAADADQLKQDFIQGYYGKASPVITEYISLLQKTVSATGTRLDIYGNPVNDHAAYLSPGNMNAYSELMDKAEQLVENDITALKHIQGIRLSQEYVYLQQLKFYGKDQHGLFQKNSKGEYAIREGLPRRLEKFILQCKEAGVKELSEGGLSPDQYAVQWQAILNTGPKNNLAANAAVKLMYPYAPEYLSKKERTLVDETPGYEDFSYNWLCFYGVPFEALVDMGLSKKVTTISLNFLEDARHWIFHPSSVSLEVSIDGVQYQTINTIHYKTLEEDYTLNFMPAKFSINSMVRYIRVKANNQQTLPPWRYHKYKKPMIACDEIWVE